MVGRNGRVGLACFPYHVGAWLAGETVEIVFRNDARIEIFHRGGLVKAHARRHPKDGPAPVRGPAPPAETALARAGTGRNPHVHGGSTGCVSFAGKSYRDGEGLQGPASRGAARKGHGGVLAGRRADPHPQSHPRPSKLYGAFTNPGGRPRKKKAS